MVSVAEPFWTRAENPEVMAGPVTVTTFPETVALCPAISQLLAVEVVQPLIEAAILLATVLLLLLDPVLHL